MLIFPGSVLLCKIIGKPGKHSKNDPLAPPAIEGTIWMVLSIPVAIAAALYRIECFCPAMLLVIAGGYLTFATLYAARFLFICVAGRIGTTAGRSSLVPLGSDHVIIGRW